MSFAAKSSSINAADYTDEETSSVSQARASLILLVLATALVMVASDTGGQ